MADFNIDLKAVGQRIRQRRKELGWTLERAALAAGVSSAQICRVEQGQSGTKWPVIVALADAMGKSPEWFVVARKDVTTKEVWTEDELSLLEELRSYDPGGSRGLLGTLRKMLPLLVEQAKAGARGFRRALAAVVAIYGQCSNQMWAAAWA